MRQLRAELESHLKRGDNCFQYIVIAQIVIQLNCMEVN